MSFLISQWSGAFDLQHGRDFAFPPPNAITSSARIYSNGAIRAIAVHV